MSRRNGKFRTHCFRCGGAQYRFMWAEWKWNLKAVKWWGGWLSSENVGTIMQYLLDELMLYEEGFTDIMMEDRPINCHETFMGALDSPIMPISAQDLQVFGTSLIQQVQLAVATTIQPFSPTPSLTPMLSNTLHPVPSLEFHQCTYYLV
jgi:hypothetical protein